MGLCIGRPANTVVLSPGWNGQLVCQVLRVCPYPRVVVVPCRMKSRQIHVSRGDSGGVSGRVCRQLSKLYRTSRCPRDWMVSGRVYEPL